MEGSLMSFPGNSQPDLNLEQQRKRAKDLRRGHRDRNLEAAVRDARHLPRARNQSTEEVLRSTSTLSEDRKSTRLNSSHVRISYAVFCLKKKKIRHQI